MILIFKKIKTFDVIFKSNDSLMIFLPKIGEAIKLNNELLRVIDIIHILNDDYTISNIEIMIEIY
jgi:hypothetical protein